MEPPVVSPAEQAAAAAAADAAFGPEQRSVKLPEPGVPAYHLYLTDGEAFMTAGDHRVIDRWSPLDRPMSLLFDLHAHLMAGDAGERVGGVIALLGALLVATGLVLWWPSRRRFTLRGLLPRAFTRRDLLVSHRDLGALASPLLLVLLLTGGGIVFYGTARTLLNGLFGDGVPSDLEPVAGATAGPAITGAALFARAAEVLPDARLVFYYPDTGTGVHGFRLKRPCELHPNGRSYVYLDVAGRVLGSVDACAAAPGERATHAIYPLHSGKTPSATYKLLVFLGGALLALISATGAASYLRRLFPPSR